MGIPSRSCEDIESNKLDETLFISINGVWDLSSFGFYNNSNCNGDLDILLDFEGDVERLSIIYVK